MKRPVSVISPMYSASAIAGVGLHAEPVHQVPHDLRRAGRVGHDVVERAEARVVVVVVDVQQVRAVAQHARGVAVDVAAVEEHDGALGDVGGRLADQALEREEAVLARQRQVGGRDEHRGVLAERASAGPASRRASRARRRRGSRARRARSARPRAGARAPARACPGPAGLVAFAHGLSISLDQLLDAHARGRWCRRRRTRASACA